MVSLFHRATIIILKIRHKQTRRHFKECPYLCQSLKEISEFRKKLLIMAALWNRAGHYIFCPVVSSSFYLLFFLAYSQPLQIGCLPTSTHAVALVGISDRGLKHAARGSLKIQDAKNCQKFAICAPSHNFVGLYLRN